MIHYIIGSATQPIGRENKILCHICNNIGAWGAGFVKAISYRWSEPEQVYLRRARSSYLRLGEVLWVQVQPDFYVANMIAQHGIRSRSNPIPIQYPAVATCLGEVRAKAIELNASVHMPRIGCGLAGGKWNKIEALIKEQLDGIEVFVYDLEKRR